MLPSDVLRICSRYARVYSTAQAVTTPHPALTYLPRFFSDREQSLLLRHSLKLLSDPARNSSPARKRFKAWKKAHPDWDGATFASDEAYEYEQRHFDAVIRQYREMLVRPGHWPADDNDLAQCLQKLYGMLPPSSSSSSSSSSATPSAAESSEQANVDQPDHLSLHILHLASDGEIKPHVDNREASGGTILGVSLGSERIVRFTKARDADDAPADGPDTFDWLLEPGSVYIQKEPLRSYYTHEIPVAGEWHGRKVGGRQRLSLMLRDKLEGGPPAL